MAKQKKKLTLKDILLGIIIHAELVLVAIIVVLPVLWIVAGSFNSTSSLASSGFFPKNPTFNNYIELFKETEYFNWYKNTFFIAVLNTVFSVFMITSVAYIFSRFKFVGKKFGFLTILVLQMFPSFLSMTAIYVLFLTFGLLNKPLALTLVYTAGAIPYNTWLVKGYLQNIPKELDEAAYIDGASRVQTFFKVILPLTTPILTFVAVTQFMAPWMDYILPRLLISTDSKKTLAVGLFEMVSGRANDEFTMFAAGVVLVAVPITLLYMFLQRYLIEGITAGANKG